MLQSTDVLKNERNHKKEAILNLLLSIAAVSESNIGRENLQCYMLKPNILVKPNPATPVTLKFKSIHVKKGRS